MDSGNIVSKADKYKEELMRLYGKRVITEENADIKENTESVSSDERNDEKVEEINEGNEEITEEAEEELEKTDEKINYSTETSEDEESFQEVVGEADQGNADEFDEIEQRYPQPDLSELDEGESSLLDNTEQESLGDSTGYILVNVRTGREAVPIEGASVIVNAVLNGKRMIIAAGMTDISGTTLKLETPAPDIEYSQYPDSAVRPYSLFDITVTARGFFNARSVDVPVFSGITSIQNFNMVPVPLFMESDDETLTYFNQEPNL